ncbi:MAG: hypothetical protein ACI9EF_000596 [Pseudohongiellaceae bacterium]|jgi:hypothetical protein
MFAGMARSASTQTVSVILLSFLLFVVALGLALLASTVLFPQGGPALLIAIAAVGFLGLQAFVFRLLGLRSQADKLAQTEEPHSESSSAGQGNLEGAVDENNEREAGRDWRAWKG